MRKWVFIPFAILICLSLLLAACGGNRHEEYDPVPEDAASEAAEAADTDTENNECEAEATNTESGVSDIENEASAPASISPLSLTTEHFLEDLGYMLYVLQNNFALFDVAYWARGVDIYAIMDTMREEVLFEPEMTVYEFYELFRHHLAPLHWIAHFGVITPERRNFYLHEPGGAVWRRFFSGRALGRLMASHVADLYELLSLRAQDNEAQDEDGWMYEFATFLMEMTEQEIREYYAHVVGRLNALGEAPLAEEFIQAAIAGDVLGLLQLMGPVEEALSLSNNVTTRIIEQGRIAYLSVNSFMSYPVANTADERKIFNFYEEIRYFDHLIIDLRFNGGGAPNWFYRTILEPNIDRTFEMEGFVFLSYGDYAAEYADIRYGSAITPVSGMPRSMDSSLRPVSEILDMYALPGLNLADMERMDYGFRVQTTVSPRAYAPRFCYEPAFQGNIWFLTGTRMGSAAQVSAWAARETGFATLVGDITGGHLGGARTIVNLPNSGIAFAMDLFYVTDRYGRPHEAGTIPHIFNKEGMDALETVLALIAAEEY